MTGDVQITLTKAEALVIFEVLSRFVEGDDDYQIKLHDFAESHSLAKLQGHLEKVLVEIFSPAYDDYLASAKAELLERYGVP